jgi:short-subunit dehydrogenase
MERAIFGGKNVEDAQARRDQLDLVLSTPVVEKPEDVAKAIWEAVKHQRAEVLVGSANLSKASYNMFPGFMQWVFRKTFQLKDKEA